MSYSRTAPAIAALWTALSVLALPAAAQPAPTLTTLHNFRGGNQDGAIPNGIVEGRDGVLYGTTEIGGMQNSGSLRNGDGIVFALTPPASPGGAWTESGLSLSGGYGQRPHAGVAIGSSGVLYGAAYHSFTIFAAKPPTSPGQSWHAKAIGGGGPAIIYPSCVLAVGNGDVLYGTSIEGGSTFDKIGDVFSMTPPAAPGGAWTTTVLYDFLLYNNPLNSDGFYPESGVVIGGGGVLYGTTSQSFQNGTPGGAGIVYSLTPPAAPGGTWTETVLHWFGLNPGDGLSPGAAGVVIGTGGVLYGTTTHGGSGTACTGGCGTVYSLTPPPAPGGAWTETILYNFTGGNDGSNPNGGVVVGRTGILYGTATNGGTGTTCSGGCGVVFSLTPPATPGGTWTQTVLHSFTGIDGAYPSAPLVIGRNGGLYGTTTAGGMNQCPIINGCGTVFQLE
jgi:hypothetical protein